MAKKKGHLIYRCRLCQTTSVKTIADIEKFVSKGGAMDTVHEEPHLCSQDPVSFGVMDLIGCREGTPRLIGDEYERSPESDQGNDKH